MILKQVMSSFFLSDKNKERIANYLKREEIL